MIFVTGGSKKSLPCCGVMGLTLFSKSERRMVGGGGWGENGKGVYNFDVAEKCPQRFASLVFWKGRIAE